MSQPLELFLNSGTFCLMPLTKKKMASCGVLLVVVLLVQQKSDSVWKDFSNQIFASFVSLFHGETHPPELLCHFYIPFYITYTTIVHSLFLHYRCIERFINNPFCLPDRQLPTETFGQHGGFSKLPANLYEFSFCFLHINIGPHLFLMSWILG